MTGVMLTMLAAALELPPTPRLLLDRVGVEALRAKSTQPAWSERWQAFCAGVDTQLREPLDLPPRGGNWSHHYVCPEHGARLKEGKRVGAWEWEHTCPVGPHTLRGDASKASLDFDGNAIGAVHGRLAVLACDAGVLWQVTGEQRYLEGARAVLAAYAERYTRYELHDNHGRKGKGARVHSQSLTEASWLIPMVQAADLVWADLSAEERQAAEKGLLRPCVEQILLPGFGQVHNIHCRLASAIGLTGLLLDDRALIDRALAEDRGGFGEQVAKGIREDGMWFEGASGYHFFTIDGLLPLAVAAGHCGVDLWSPKLKSLFDAPLALATPDLRLPPFNDSGTVDLRGTRDAYELAYAHWQDPAYLGILGSGARSGRRALLYGVPELPKAGPVATQGSRNSPASGYAILQAGPGEDATWLCLKYGPHGGGHGHPDKNHFILRAARADCMPDGGTHAYGSPLHNSWDKTSLAHNTLVVDEASQAAATGACLGFGRTASGADYAVTDAGAIYLGIRFVRAVAMLDATLVVVVDRVLGEAPHTLDLACHFRGAWGDLPAGKPWSGPAKPGYQRFGKTTARDASPGIVLTVKPAAGPDTVLTLAAAGEATEAICGVGVGESTAVQPAMVLFRRQAAATWFAWAVSLDGTPAPIACQAEGERVHVTVRRGDRRWALVVDPAAGTVE